VIRILIPIVAVLVLVGGAVGASLLGVLPIALVPKSATAAQPTPVKPPVTVMYPTGERIVNLTDTPTLRYLKVNATLEFIDHTMKDPPQGPAIKTEQDAFAGDLSAYTAVIDDALTTTFSSHSSAELLTADGKAKLKQDLIDHVNAALHDQETVVNVYFVTFVIQ
jgi:flagellar basal body-associated protein FliL